MQLLSKRPSTLPAQGCSLDSYAMCHTQSFANCLFTSVEETHRKLRDRAGPLSTYQHSERRLTDTQHAEEIQAGPTLGKQLRRNQVHSYWLLL